VQALAAWLVARPQNAVLALAATLLLPVLQILSGIFMVLLVLRQGVRLAIVEGIIAAALLTLIALLAGVPVMQIVVSALTTWLPAVFLAGMLLVTRSLTLTMQVSVLVAAVVALGFHVVVGDMTVFWQPAMDFMIDWARESNLHEQAQLIKTEPAMVAHTLTIVFVASSWTLSVLYLLFGNRLTQALPGESVNYGRFCDLNFGRVIALIMALTSLLAVASGMAWLQSIAFVIFAVFWLQGLAVVHWLFVDGELPLFVVILTYVLMPFLHVFLMLALAVVGYTDAWFVFRRRVATRQ
jgi:hypothetical protein